METVEQMTDETELEICEAATPGPDSGATFEVNSRLTHKSLMKKSKTELAHRVLDFADFIDSQQERVKELLEENQRECQCEWVDICFDTWGIEGKWTVSEDHDSGKPPFCPNCGGEVGIVHE